VLSLLFLFYNLFKEPKEVGCEEPVQHLPTEKINIQEVCLFLFCGSCHYFDIFPQNSTSVREREPLLSSSSSGSNGSDSDPALEISTRPVNSEPAEKAVTFCQALFIPVSYLVQTY
jgi:hypothetical protein